MTDTTIVNKNGQVIIPQEIRERLGIEEGSVLDFKIRGNQIVIKAKDLERNLSMNGAQL